MMGAPLIFEIKGNALDDGPGIRTVIFFKGCPLSCAWCHNPEGQISTREISFDSALCIGCDECIDVCTPGALDRGVDGFINRALCDFCGDCIEVCPSGALEFVGREMSVENILADCEKDIPFFKTSGGGVTFSGGEATVHLEYAGALAQRLCEMGVHVLLETCGQYNKKRFDKLLYPHLGSIYFDIKVMDSSMHKKLCGVGNEKILENFSILQKRCSEGGVELLPRVPLIPSMTATQKNLAAIAVYLKNNGVSRVALLPYHPFWEAKPAKLGHKPEPDADCDELKTILPKDKLEWCRTFFTDFEIV